MNIPIEKAFYEFATEIDLEEVWEFAEIFVFSKRLGNDYSKNLKLCADRIGSKLELRGEIETSIVEKQMEMKVMCILPIILLVFLKLSAADFIGVLYSNLAGKLVMTVALAMYVSGVVLSYVIVKKGEDI
jgi:tight adherence protein B